MITPVRVQISVKTLAVHLSPEQIHPRVHVAVVSAGRYRSLANRLKADVGARLAQVIPRALIEALAAAQAQRLADNAIAHLGQAGVSCEAHADADNGGGAIRVELSVALVGHRHSVHLNQEWRQRSGTFNVLSFSLVDTQSIAMLGVGQPLLLGDVVICLPHAVHEAQQLARPLDSHLALLSVHGLLHVLGHDHALDKHAEQMQADEARFLALLGLETEPAPQIVPELVTRACAV